jgi:hypothetical protein
MQFTTAFALMALTYRSLTAAEPVANAAPAELIAGNPKQCAGTVTSIDYLEDNFCNIRCACSNGRKNTHQGMTVGNEDGCGFSGSYYTLGSPCTVVY